MKTTEITAPQQPANTGGVSRVGGGGSARQNQWINKLLPPTPVGGLQSQAPAAHQMPTGFAPNAVGWGQKMQAVGGAQGGGMVPGAPAQMPYTQDRPMQGMLQGFRPYNATNEMRGAPAQIGLPAHTPREWMQKPQGEPTRYAAGEAGGKAGSIKAEAPVDPGYFKGEAGDPNYSKVPPGYKVPGAPNQEVPHDMSNMVRSPARVARPAPTKISLSAPVSSPAPVAPSTPAEKPLGGYGSGSKMTFEEFNQYNREQGNVGN